MEIGEQIDDPAELLEQFAERTPDVFWMFSADWEQLLFINDAYEEIYGRSTAALREDPRDFLQAVHPEDRDRLLADMEAASNGESIEHEYRVNAEEGFGRWVVAKGEPVFVDGEIVRVAGFVREITAQRHQEQRLQERERVLREIYDVTSDSSLSFTDQVQELLAIGCDALDIAYGTLSEIRGEDYIFKVVEAPAGTIEAGDVAELAATNCERTASTEERVVLGNVEEDAPELTDKDGFTEWGIACYLGAPVMVDGAVYGTFCFYDEETRESFSQWEITLVDLMSQWVGYEMTRQQTRDALERQNEQLEDFTSIVSHDLRNPLGVATGRLELAMEDCDNPHLADVAGALDRMEALIDDLLALAQDGARVDELEPVSLGALVDRCWNDVEYSDCTLINEADIELEADEARLRQLLENLLRNAVEHGGEAPTVTVGDLDDGFFLEDDGPGIPVDDRTTVFEPGHTTEPEGTGFGLSIVADVVDAHGWTITVTESPAGGARFEITGVERS